MEVNPNADFSGESTIVTSADDNQNIFIIKDLNSATTYYARVKTDVSGFGPVTTFTTRDPITRLRLWGIASFGGIHDVGTIFSYSIDDNSFIKHYDQPLYWDGFDSIEVRAMGTLVPGPDGLFYGHIEQNYSAGMFQVNSQGIVEPWGGSAYFLEAQLALASNNYIYATNNDTWVPGVVDKYDIANQTLLLDSRMDFFKQNSDPNTPLIELSDGNLYGAAGEGGVNEGGFIYRFRLDGSGFRIIHYFHDTGSGMKPHAGLIEHEGFLYGTTTGGAYGNHGTIFRIRPEGTDFSKLHDFNGINGSFPRSELILLNDVLYGTTEEGGGSGMGTVFSMNLDGTGYSVMHSFNGADGAKPSRGLVHDRDGNLYGMTSHGGANNMGVIFKVSTTGSGFTRLFDFTQSSGGHPTGALVIREDTFSASPTFSNRLDDEQTMLRVSVYPNPTMDNFEVTVASPNNTPVKMVVMDQYGQTVGTYAVTPGLSMQVGRELKRGVYIMKVFNGKTVTLHRLVKK